MSARRQRAGHRSVARLRYRLPGHAQGAQTRAHHRQIVIRRSRCAQRRVRLGSVKTTALTLLATAIVLPFVWSCGSSDGGSDGGRPGTKDASASSSGGGYGGTSEI